MTFLRTALTPPLPHRPHRGLSKYAADGRCYEDRRSEQEQSSNNLFVQGRAAMEAYPSDSG